MFDDHRPHSGNDPESILEALAATPGRGTTAPGGARSLARSFRIPRGDDDLSATARGEAAVAAPPDLGKGAPEFDEHDVNSLGMTLFLASLTMIFGATLVAFGIFRWKEGSDWVGAEAARDLGTLVVATIVLVTCDVLATKARNAHADRTRALRLTRASLWLATVYLVVQSWNWWATFASIVPPEEGPRLSMEATLFLMLTFTHAIHVLGGVVADAIVVYRSKQDGVGPRKASLDLLYRYWRFLTVVWFVLVAVILAT